jgi:hypothetical protein
LFPFLDSALASSVVTWTQHRLSTALSGDISWGMPNVLVWFWEFIQCAFKNQIESIAPNSDFKKVSFLAIYYHAGWVIVPFVNRLSIHMAESNALEIGRMCRFCSLPQR